MLKYTDVEVTFAEIPDEISLCINLSNCPNHCSDCHSKYLWEDVGEPLNKEGLFKLINDNEGITCVCLMGGDQAINSINWLAKCMKESYPKLKVGWYSGKAKLDENIILDYFDYIKIGPYIKEYGPINVNTTNQRLYEYNEVFSDYTIGKCWRDITYKFWRNEQNNNA